MHALYVFSVWLHILAATAWIGGMFFIVLVVVPWLRRRGSSVDAGAFLRETGQRFRTVGWACFVVLLLTGTFNLWVRGVRLSSLTDGQWLSSPFGQTVLLKLGLFTLVLIVSAVHDFSIGPRAAVALARDPESDEARGLRRRAALVGRANALLALLLVLAGVMLVRGALW